MADTILLAAINAKWIHPSLALRLLKANLGPLEDRCHILEFALRQGLSEKVEPILAAAPKILGLSVSIWNHRATLELLEALESRWGPAAPRPLIVLGGPEVSYLPEGAPICRHADYVIRGEGELAFRELCRGALGPGPGGLPRGKFIRGEGLIPKNPACAGGALGRSKRVLNPSPITSGEQHTSPFRARLLIEAPPVDLAAIAPAYRLYTAEDLGRKLIYVEAGRGCPFGCEFCQAPGWNRDGPDRRVREFPLEPFLAEMDRLLERRARLGGKTPFTLKFLDRTFNLDISRARGIMEFFLAKLGAAPGLCVHFEMVPSRFPPELREIIRRFPPGSLRLEIGIQTLNREIAARIGRPGDPERDLETVAFLRGETRAILHADLIAGLPGEDTASFGAGFDRLWMAMTAPHAGTAPFEIQPGILKRLPGAPIARHDRAFGMVYAPEPPYEVLESGVLCRADMDRLKNFARFWEIIVNRGAFPDLGARLFPPGEPVFDRFMALSDSLLAHFGRNWGIDRGELRGALEAYTVDDIEP